MTVAATLLTIAFVCFCSAFFVSGVWFGLAPLAGLVLSFVAGAFCLVSRSSPSEDADRPRATQRSALRGLVCVALALALLNAAVAVGALGVARGIAKSEVPRASLRGIGLAVKAYHERHGEYPPTLPELVGSGLLSPSECVDPYDWHSTYNRVTEDGYSSFIYTPGSGAWRDDADLILAYERLAWSWGRATFWSPRGYSVLFADLSVRWLDVHEFGDALHRDCELRKEIAWPMQP